MRHLTSMQAFRAAQPKKRRVSLQFGKCDVCLLIKSHNIMDPIMIRLPIVGWTVLSLVKLCL